MRLLLLRHLIKTRSISSQVVRNGVTSSQQVMSPASFHEAKSIFVVAVAAVEPCKLIENSVRLEDGHLMVNNQSYELQKPCYVVAFGKAVLGMVIAVENILGDWIKEGMATVPLGIFECFKDNPLYKIKEKTKIKYFEGAKDNLPDEAAYEGALAIKELLKQRNEDDLVIVLISGGGSALLPLPKEGVTLHGKMDLIRKLGKRGADVMELAKVRKKLSQVKGGGIAELAYPAKVVTLILSDVIGDPLEYIAGGPTAVNTDTPNSVLDVLNKYSLLTDISESTKAILETKNHREKSTVVPIIDGRYQHVWNTIIGNNKIAVNAAAVQADSLGYRTIILSTQIEGEVSNIARFYAELIKRILEPSSNLDEFLGYYRDQFDISNSTIKSIRDFKSEERLCILGAGELSVVVHGKGKGGRNQQLALAVSVELNEFDLNADITFLSCGTDGIDGPTDAAGAIGTSHLVNNSLVEGINPVDYLSDNDSYGFYARYDGGSHLVRIGHTGTNVMDIHVILINRKQ